MDLDRHVRHDVHGEKSSSPGIAQEMANDAQPRGCSEFSQLSAAIGGCSTYLFPFEVVWWVSE